MEPQEQHTFIVEPSSWAGEGTITLSMVEEALNFVTNWKIGKKEEGKIVSQQEIQIVGISENMRNDLVFFDFSSKGFSVEMENPNIGKVVGIGIWDDKMIGWEFRNPEINFEGYETYMLQPDGSYHMHAEYVTSDQFRTQIEGKIYQAPLKHKKNEEIV